MAPDLMTLSIPEPVGVNFTLLPAGSAGENLCQVRLSEDLGSLPTELLSCTLLPVQNFTPLCTRALPAAPPLTRNPPGPQRPTGLPEAPSACPSAQDPCCPFSVLPKFGFCTPCQIKSRRPSSGRSRKSFIALPGKGGPDGLMPSRL